MQLGFCTGQGATDAHGRGSLSIPFRFLEVPWQVPGTFQANRMLPPWKDPGLRRTFLETARKFPGGRAGFPGRRCGSCLDVWNRPGNFQANGRFRSRFPGRMLEGCWKNPSIQHPSCPHCPPGSFQEGASSRKLQNPWIPPCFPGSFLEGSWEHPGNVQDVSRVAEAISAKQGSSMGLRGPENRLLFDRSDVVSHPLRFPQIWKFAYTWKLPGRMQ
eukprot:gene15801-biopygen2434